MRSHNHAVRPDQRSCALDLPGLRQMRGHGARWVASEKPVDATGKAGTMCPVKLGRMTRIESPLASILLGETPCTSRCHAAKRRMENQRAFLFSGSALDDLGHRDTLAQGSSGLTGFGVTESPDRCGTQPRRKILKAGGCRSTGLDAPMPWLRKAETRSSTQSRVGFASPSTVHQKAVNRNRPWEQ